jgi:prephenate dehydratase
VKEVNMSKIVFQGALGSYSNIASEKVFPNGNYIPVDTFEEAMSLVQQDKADYAVIPVENSNAGRVTDVHFLLPQTSLTIVGEYFLRIEHQLLSLPDATMEDIKCVASHPQALAQCSNYLKRYKLKTISQIDTAKSCIDVIEKKDKSVAVIASSKAGEIYGMKTLASNIENDSNNTTRFLIMSKNKNLPPLDDDKYITSLVFMVKHVPSSLYHALGVFAKRDINVTKLESYVVNGNFISAQFYIELEGHCESDNVKKALKELEEYAENMHFLGTYKADKYR